MKFFRIVIIAALFSAIGILNAQQKPKSAQQEAVTIVGATAHLGNGEVIENSLLIFEDGIITQIMDARTTKMQYRGRIIEAKGKHIFPGLLAPAPLTPSGVNSDAPSIGTIFGTLEKGRDATLLIADGKVLDTRTNVITHAFFKGDEINLKNRQTQLENCHGEIKATE
jgi:imidazolonepropionase-like amidohydrolase